MPDADKTAFLRGIEPLISRYRGFLLDQYGVLHDGQSVIPGARDALDALRRAGRTVVILSNSGKRSAANEARLERIGIPRALYTGLISSGEAAWRALRNGGSAAFSDLGRRCLYISRGNDLSAVEGLPLEVTDSAADADFILLSGLDADPTARAAIARSLETALELRLPLVCTNPDLVSLEGERRVDGPGAFAAGYAKAGGEVRYVGKPWPEIYRAALAVMEIPTAEIVAIGDSLDHDVAGTGRFGIDGTLIIEGVHAEAFGDVRTEAVSLARLEQLCAGRSHRPRWLLRRFSLERDADGA